MKTILTVLVTLLSLAVNAQQLLTLQNKKGPQKIFYLSTNRYYTVKTKTKMHRNVVIFKATDSTACIKQTRWSKDSIIVPFKDILCVKKPLFKNKEWLQPFAWFAIGAVMAIPMLPIAILTEGVKVISDWLLFEGILVGVSGVPIGIASLKVKRNTQSKWVLK